MRLIRWSQCAAPRHAERCWRATFYTTGMEHSPTSATGTAVGAHAVASDAAGGVGGALKDRAMSLPSQLANNWRLRWAAVRELHGSAWWNEEPLI
jgi:hypothetical protein